MNAATLRRIAAICAVVLLWVATGSALAQSVANGASLFSTYCQACHGNPPVGGASLAGNNPAMIRAAINGRVPDLRILAFLTDANLADIAAWIASLSAPPPPPPATPPAPERDYSDLWYGGETESGWGLNIIQHASNNIFAVMYTYDANRRPIWFVLPGGTWTSSTSFSGKWYRVTGSPYQVPWVGADVREVGTATLTFSSASTATFGFTVNGTVVNKTMQRQPF